MCLVRKLESRDTEDVYSLGMQIPQFAVGDQAHHRFWEKDVLKRFAHEGFSFVIEDKKVIRGFLLAVYQPITQKLTWENMYIEPQYRRRGLAEECFQKSWKLAQENGAKIAESLVESNNLPSLKMLNRLGFINAGTYNWMLKWSE